MRSAPALAKASAGVLMAGAAAGIVAFMPSAASPAPQVRPAPVAGRSIYLQDCAWCHGPAGEGTDFGPTLRGVGPASTDFMLSTGRMPIPKQIDNPPQRPVRYTREEIAAITQYVASFAPGPPIPRVDPGSGDETLGLSLYQANCAACHGATGTGGALTQGLLAPSVLDSTPREIAEAMRLGGAGLLSGNMPRFGPEQLDERDVDSIVAYIEHLPREDRGGLSLGRVGPVAEGFVAWAVGMLTLYLVIRWIGERG